MTIREQFRLAGQWLEAKRGLVLAEKRIRENDGTQRTVGAMALLRHCMVRDILAEALRTADVG